MATAIVRVTGDAGRFEDALGRHGVRPPYVLFVGRITDQKGIFHLIEAAGRLPRGRGVKLLWP